MSAKPDFVLPDPEYLGLPSKFRSWRNGQDRAVLRAADTLQRFYVPCAPTGFGKTLLYVALALLTGKRTAILTATKGLQTQIGQDFAECGLVDIRGQNNYLCHAIAPGGELEDQGICPGGNCDAGPCHVGAFCSLRHDGCLYFDKLAEARRAKLLVINYRYWIAQHRYADGLGPFDLLVLDEGHDAADELAQSMETVISEFDTGTILGMALPDGEDVEGWREWGKVALAECQRQETRIQAQIDNLVSNGYQDRKLFHERFALRTLAKKLEVAATMEGDWVIERWPHYGKLAPVWPARYTEKYLFLKIPRVVLISATILPKSLEMLGIEKGTYEYVEYPSTFPIERRPVVYVPTVVVRHDWDDLKKRAWVNRIDQIIEQRLDRKGIIHTVSYDRRDLIMTWSRHRRIMLANDPKNTRTTVERFRNAPAPCVLVSPSLTTGWDLPYEDCEYSIISKIPFPDKRSRIVAARNKYDKDYGNYTAMQTIVQASGRGMRSENDSCEVLIIDDQWVWFWRNYKHFAPAWFKNAVRSSQTIPTPLPKLTFN